jgi:hypothetical protein
MNVQKDMLQVPRPRLHSHIPRKAATRRQSKGRELSTEHRRFTAAVYLLQFILVVALARAFSPGCAFPRLRVLGMLFGGTLTEVSSRGA